ncbi:SNase-domain-containing protein [Suillus bovinus]|uniref:SNase-domain-containing protein n=1 Tax=Suillus bovinus TaxID=48563 RepID=UPI001B8769AD|nr:SNase-domain-containing protein [Suillus bovinus]KAG2133784.1 SNase-domain-containing protein [Suillus bovinus]
MHLPWRQKKQASEEDTSSLPSEQHGPAARWSATKDVFKRYVATTQANANTTLQEYNANIQNRLRARAYDLGSRPAAYLILSGIFLGSVSTLGTTFVYRRYFRRLRTAEWITPDILQRKRWVRGVVTSVGDADNFRLYHTPGFGWRWPLKFRRVPTLNKDLREQTIHVRIAGVDAPEGSHFGRQAQPYASEALAWLKNMIEGKIVYCQLVRRDQYFRIVSVVTLAPSLLPGWLITGRSLALEMIRAGTGLTYVQAGAEYGKYGKDEFLRVEAESRAARRGMWKHGTVGETPAQYKRRHAQGGTEVEAQAQGTVKAERENSKKGGPRRILKRLWRWNG